MNTDMICKLIMNMSIEDLEKFIELKKCTYKTEEEMKHDINYLLETSKGYVSPLRKRLTELENSIDNKPLTLSEIDKLSSTSMKDMEDIFIKLDKEIYTGLGISENFIFNNGYSRDL